MLSVVAHELTETVTDPGKKGIAAWIDVDGEENADKCAWQFGNSYKLSSGASSNERIGGLDVLIQENWDPESQKCTMGDSALIVDRSAWGRFVGWWRKTF